MQAQDDVRIDNHLFSEINKYMNRELFCYLSSEKIFDEYAVNFMECFFRIKERRLRCMLVHSGSQEYINEGHWELLKNRIENRLKPVLCHILGPDLLVLIREQPGHKSINMDEKINLFVKTCLDSEQERGVIWFLGEWTNSLRSLVLFFGELKRKTGGKKYRPHKKNVQELYDCEIDLFKAAIKRRWSEAQHCMLRSDALRREMDRGIPHLLTKNKAYYCYLWRQADRYIYQTTGKRKVIEDKATIDSKIEKAKNNEELMEITLLFLQKYIELLDLDNLDYSARIIEKVKEYVTANLKDNLSLETLAEIAGVSSFYLSKLFKKKENICFKDYVIKIRMEKAKQLLRYENICIKQAAYEVGYPDANYFSKAFKKYTGFSAKNYSG